MGATTSEPEVVRVSQKGQATIPKALREELGIRTPGEVFIYREGNRVVIEPVPTLEELHGIHAGDHEPGDVLAAVREMDDRERAREEAEVERLVERHGDASEE